MNNMITALRRRWRSSFVKIRIFDFDLGCQSRIPTPSRVELIGKRSILCLELQPIDRARSQLSKTPLIAFLQPLQAKIWRNGRIRREWVLCVALNDGQATGRRTIPEGALYSPLNQLSNKPLFTF